MNIFSSYVFPFLKSIQISDIVDIIIVAVVVYSVAKFVRRTRAAQLIKGIAILLVVMYLSDWLNLNVVHFILINTMQIGLTALIIVFQPELRRALEHLGGTKFGDMLASDSAGDTANTVDEVCIAVSSLSKTKTGALIVFERKNMLEDFLTGGTVINSEISSEILENIFVPNTPLHDGAVIVKGDKIHIAAAVLPLSSNKNLSKEFGTRHRASLGISEISDCVSLTVSEETGRISVSLGGNMIRNLSVASLNKLLNKLLAATETDKKTGYIKTLINKGRDKQ